MKPQEKPRNPRTSTVGRGKALPPSEVRGASAYSDEHVNLSHGDSLDFYHNWEQPTVIVSDGAYGILGFKATLLITLESQNGMKPISPLGAKKRQLKPHYGFGTPRLAGLQHILFYKSMAGDTSTLTSGTKGALTLLEM